MSRKGAPVSFATKGMFDVLGDNAEEEEEEEEEQVQEEISAPVAKPEYVNSFAWLHVYHHQCLIHLFFTWRQQL
jgi:hypothetical protein